jgi:hypothetical protein
MIGHLYAPTILTPRKESQILDRTSEPMGPPGRSGQENINFYCREPSAYTNLAILHKKYK